jgi:hypothetical protein
MNKNWRISITILLLSTLIFTACSGQIFISAAGENGDGNSGSDGKIDIGIGNESGDGEESPSNSGQTETNYSQRSSTTRYFLILSVIILALIVFSFIVR